MKRVTSLITAGADVDYVDDWVRHNLLTYICKYIGSDGLVCDEPFCEVISVSLHMSVITQDGNSALKMAVRRGRTKVVSLLLEAGANTDLQNKVKCQ